ncbi:sensor histidine kinase [Compostimonas suwonensis]|uniref:sensor histidine kinase n=1 Tax=Compostimonas suwonensis TaxID=1048394 RepID=UPI001FE433E3|nr:histidine kinase [Compostimonas suwonensis]
MQDRSGRRSKRLIGRLLTPGAYRWYLGAMFGLVYQILEFIVVWSGDGPLAEQIVVTVLLVAFYLGFLVLPPLVWPEPVLIKVLAIVVYWVATVALFPFLGVDALWVWTLVAAMIGFTWLPMRTALVLALALVGVLFAIVVATGFPSSVSFAPVVTASVAFSMIAFSRQIVANRRLREAQAEIGRLAAMEERARLARDLHDVLGHSLTVVAVKAELAGRLVGLDPRRARVEIADVEQLARTALADLRSSVSNYREADLDAELAAARSALDAAGITARLPDDTSAVDDEVRTAFAWVLREGVTNVIRHSEAGECWVELGPRRLVVRDDGVGSATTASTPGTGDGAGNGLRGLTERAKQSGLRLRATDRVDGGFELVVEEVGT